MVTFNFAQTPVTQIADAIIIEASRKNASDIHFDPRDNGLMVRLRIDGDLMDYAYIPKAYERNLTTRLKLMSGMNITESRLPQDGAIKGNFGGKELDMRASCLPTNEGEKIVIRILDYTRSLGGLDDLGFSDDNLVKIKRMVAAPNGIILVTGATGSGKSTTTYSMLQVLNKENTNIITVEDPIEMNIEGLNQVQVNSEIGLTFATVLRSILRQDPNVILIGEIRDSETAQIAVRASITGHLVLSTIHTNNSLATIERLLDMNVEKYLLSTAITGIVSQRLAKMLCKNCRRKRKTTPYEKKVFKLALRKDVDEIWDVNPDGCNECNHGYKGRIALQEVLEISDEISSAINEVNTDRDELRKLVYGTGKVTTLLQDGLNKVLAGETSFEEIYRVIEIDNDIDDSCMAFMSEDKEEQAVENLKTVEKAEVVEVEQNDSNIENKVKTDVESNTTSALKEKVMDDKVSSNANKVINNSASSILTSNAKQKVAKTETIVVPKAADKAPVQTKEAEQNVINTSKPSNENQKQVMTIKEDQKENSTNIKTETPVIKLKEKSEVPVINITADKSANNEKTPVVVVNQVNKDNNIKEDAKQKVETRAINESNNAKVNSKEEVSPVVVPVVNVKGNSNDKIKDNKKEEKQVVSTPSINKNNNVKAESKKEASPIVVTVVNAKENNSAKAKDVPTINKNNNIKVESKNENNKVKEQETKNKNSKKEVIKKDSNQKASVQTINIKENTNSKEERKHFEDFFPKKDLFSNSSINNKEKKTKDDKKKDKVVIKLDELIGSTDIFKKDDKSKKEVKEFKEKELKNDKELRKESAAYFPKKLPSNKDSINKLNLEIKKIKDRNINDTITKEDTEILYNLLDEKIKKLNDIKNNDDSADIIYNLLDEKIKLLDKKKDKSKTKNNKKTTKSKNKINSRKYSSNFFPRSIDEIK